MHGACEMNIRKGAVKGNTIVFDETLGLPDGALVDVEIRLAAAKPTFRVKPNHSCLTEGVEPLRLNRLLDELEVENYLAGNEADISPSPDAMSLEAAYGSVKPSNSPEDFNEITAIAKQAKAEETAQELNDEWNS